MSMLGSGGDAKLPVPPPAPAPEQHPAAAERVKAGSSVDQPPWARSHLLLVSGG
jgi:hypothetical protein